jgi:hypothetical protein
MWPSPAGRPAGRRMRATTLKRADGGLPARSSPSLPPRRRGRAAASLPAAVPCFRPGPARTGPGRHRGQRRLCQPRRPCGPWPRRPWRRRWSSAPASRPSRRCAPTMRRLPGVRGGRRPRPRVAGSGYRPGCRPGMGRRADRGRSGSTAPRHGRAMPRAGRQDVRAPIPRKRRATGIPLPSRTPRHGIRRSRPGRPRPDAPSNASPRPAGVLAAGTLLPSRSRHRALRHIWPDHRWPDVRNRAERCHASVPAHPFTLPSSRPWM